MSIETFNELMSVIIIPLLTALSGFLVGLLRKKISEVSQKIENDKLQKYIGLASDAVLQAVETVTQTYVDELKSNGEFTKEAHAIAKEKSLEIAQGLLTEQARVILAEAYGDIDLWLQTKVEQLVFEQVC